MANPGNNPEGNCPFKESIIKVTSIMIQDVPKIAEPRQSQVRSFGRDFVSVGIILPYVFLFFIVGIMQKNKWFL